MGEFLGDFRPFGHSEASQKDLALHILDLVPVEILHCAQNDKLGVAGVFLERTKYRVRVGRGLAPAVNLHRTPRRGQAPALPCKMHFACRERS